MCILLTWQHQQDYPVFWAQQFHPFTRNSHWCPSTNLLTSISFHVKYPKVCHLFRCSPCLCLHSRSKFSSNETDLGFSTTRSVPRSSSARLTPCWKLLPALPTGVPNWIHINMQLRLELHNQQNHAKTSSWGCIALKRRWGKSCFQMLVHERNFMHLGNGHNREMAGLKSLPLLCTISLGRRVF